MKMQRPADSHLQILRENYCKNATEEEFALFLATCNHLQLDPFAGQICAVSRWDNSLKRNKMTVQITIDGRRAIAFRSGKFAGCDPLLFDGLPLHEHRKLGQKHPDTCTATVYAFIERQRCPFSVTVPWDEFYPGDKLGFMWRDKPYQMLGKTAESQALRRAFPYQLPDKTEEANEETKSLYIEGIYLLANKILEKGQSTHHFPQLKALNRMSLSELEGLGKEMKQFYKAIDVDAKAIASEPNQ